MMKPVFEKTQRLSAMLCAALLITPLTSVAAGDFSLGRLAELQIVERSEHRALPIYWHQGKAYVVGKPGNEYQIQLRNRAQRDLLAVVSVDGVNVISGETASPQQAGYLISRGASTEISGWRKSLERTAAFYFTSLADSYAARTDRPDDVGVIGVALFQRKPTQTIRPADGVKARQAESSSPMANSENAKSTATERVGTGHGRIEEDVAQYSEFERATAQPEEVLRIYYDSFNNLVARGVIRRPPRWLETEPQPFPAQPFIEKFVPDLRDR